MNLSKTMDLHAWIVRYSFRFTSSLHSLQVGFFQQFIWIGYWNWNHLLYFSTNLSKDQEITCVSFDVWQDILSDLHNSHIFFPAFCKIFMTCMFQAGSCVSWSHTLLEEEWFWDSVIAVSQERWLPGSSPQGVLLGCFFFIVKFNGALLRPNFPRPFLKPLPMIDSRTRSNTLTIF